MFGYLLESLQVIFFASKLDKGNRKYLILSHYGNAVVILKTTEQHFCTHAKCISDRATAHACSVVVWLEFL